MEPYPTDFFRGFLDVSMTLTVAGNAERQEGPAKQECIWYELNM